MPGLQAIGRHVLVDFSGVRREALCDADATMEALRAALVVGGFHIVGQCLHRFAGGGFTGVFLLSESHAAIHTYPERGYAAVDVFSCGAVRPEDVLAALRVHLTPADAKTYDVERRVLETADEFVAARSCRE